MFNIFKSKPKRRGIVNIKERFYFLGKITKETDYEPKEVEIIEETKDMYKIKRNIELFGEEERWVEKSKVKLIELI